MIALMLRLGKRNELTPYAIFVVALVVRACALLIASRVSPNALAGDAIAYDEIALSLLRGEGFALGGRPTAIVVPGYPAFLAGIYALLGHDMASAGAVQAVLGALVAALGAWAAIYVGGTLAGWAAGLLLSVYPHFVMWTGLALTENLFLPLTMLALVLFCWAQERSDWRIFLASGVALAAATLVRGGLLTFLPFAVLLAYKSGRGIGSIERARNAGILAVAATLPLLPWVARNNAVMGAPVFATESGVVTWASFSRDAGIGHRGGYIYVQPLPSPVPLGATEVEAQAHYAEAAYAYLRTDPLAPFRHVPAKLWNMWRPVFAGSRPVTWLVLGGSYAILMIFAAAGWAVSHRNPAIRERSRVFRWFVLVMAVTHLIGLAEIRYRMPLEMALAVPAGVGVAATLGAFGALAGARVRSFGRRTQTA